MTLIFNIQKKIDKLLKLNEERGLSDREQRLFSHLVAFKVGYTVTEDEKIAIEQKIKKELPDLFKYYAAGLDSRRSENAGE